VHDKLSLVNAHTPCFLQLCVEDVVMIPNPFLLQSSGDLRSQKRLLREEAKERRRALTVQQKAMFSFAIAEQFAALPEFQRAQYVHIYCSFGAEVETGCLFSHAFTLNKHVVVPITPVAKVYAKDDSAAKTLLHTEIDPEQPFGFDRHGMPAPLPMNREDPTASLEYCLPSELFSPNDCIVIPLVAFDERCYRLGYGQGFYDRFLASLRHIGCARIGVAYSCQQIDVVPNEPHDEPLDIIITEQRVFRRESPSSGNPATDATVTPQVHSEHTSVLVPS
jgi:5-formyltetrahydrofolate cyclo-ligase